MYMSCARALLQLKIGIVLLVDISGYSSFADRAIRAEIMNDELVMPPVPATLTHAQERQHRRSMTLPICNPALPPKPVFATESEYACVSLHNYL
jgi:hypothetical protein